MLRFLLAWSSATASLGGVTGFGTQVERLPHNHPRMQRRFKKSSPAYRAVTVNTGDKVLLSVIVIGPDGTVDQGLASGADILWAATDGIISPSIESNTEVIYTSPEQVGLYTVTAHGGLEL